MPRFNHDTDHLRDLKLLREELSRATPNAEGCLIYPSDLITVRLQGHRQRMGISPARVAWALAHPDDHLGVNDFAVHICMFRWSPLSNCVCVHPEHLRKGTRADIQLMVDARARRLILQGGQQ